MASSAEQAVVAKVEAAQAPRPLLGWVLRPLLSRVEVEPGWVERMRELAGRGTLVHVLLGVGLLELLCLDQLLRAHDLPPVRMVSGARRYALRPLRWLLAVLWRRCRPCDPGRVVDVARQGESSLLLLRSSPGLRGASGSSDSADVTEALVALQRERPERPIFLVPHVVLWGRRRPTGAGVWQGLLGAIRDGPGLVRLLARTLRSRQDAQIRACEPVSLADHVAAEPADDIAAREARFAVRRRLEQERRLVLGPASKSPEAVREELLRSSGLADEIAAIAARQGLAVERLRKRARKLLREIQAEPSTSYLAGMNAFLWWVWSRLFEAVEVDEEGFARLRAVAHDGPVVLVSSHKSHVDYLILSQIFWEKNIFPPHIVAGRNLSFWPLGQIFRRCGAFFIRRRFAGDELYVAVLSAYVRKVLQDGYHLEFFIEGTRSRSGKMLPPRFGMLAMIVDAARRLKGHTVNLVPVSVTYGRVPEEGSHVAESAGQDKRSEDLGALLRTRRLFRRRHGRIYVQFGQPILVDTDGTSGPGREDDQQELRQRVRGLAYRAVYEINRVTLATPTSLVATALLLHRRRGMSHGALVAEVAVLASAAARLGARFSASLKGLAEGEPVPERVLVEAVAFLRDSGLIGVHGEGEEAIYTVPAERRLRLDYYKCMIVHPFVHAAVVASALGPRADEGRPLEEIEERVRFLSRLLKHEFTFRADAALEVNLDRSIIDLVEAGEAVRREDRLVGCGPGGGAAVRRYAALLANFLESYRVVVRALRKLGEAEVASERDLVKAALVEGERMYLVGEIELAEALAKVNLQNALRALVDLGVLEKREDGRQLALTERYRKPGRLARLERRIASYNAS